MYSIREDTIADAHLRAIHFIRSLPESETEDGEKVRQYEEPISIHINYPQHDPKVVLGSRFGPQFRSEYVNKVISITPKRNDGTDPVYTYGNRLRAHPQSSLWYKLMTWLGGTDGLDQLETIVDRLSSAPNSRRAVATLWHPETDSLSREPPCMNLLQATTYNDRLNLTAYFRSNDMLSAWGMNAYALLCLQLHLADVMQYKCGWMETISNNPHIYHIRDSYELQQIVKANGI